VRRETDPTTTFELQATSTYGDDWVALQVDIYRRKGVISIHQTLEIKRLERGNNKGNFSLDLERSTGETPSRRTRVRLFFPRFKEV
jgi:hypothetical protein